MADKGFSITFDVTGLKDTIEVLSAMPGTVQSVMKMSMGELQSKSLDIVKSETPKDTKKLADSTIVIKGTNQYSFQIGQTATAGAGRRNPDYFYGRGVRMGTKGGYYIKPNTKKALYWTKKKGSIGLSAPIPFVGPPITALHPGIQNPYNYVETSVKRLQPEIISISQKIGATVAQETFKRFRTRSI